MPMSREDFIEKYHHQIAGIVLDGATGRREGEAMSIWLRLVMAKVDAVLNKAYGELTHENKIPAAPAKPAGPRLANT